MKISIITCFYNSSALIEKYCAGVNKINETGINVELILVDNASKDGTEDELRKRAPLMRLPTTVVSERRPGLMMARCAGVERANGDFIVFFDDDNEPDADYLQVLVDLCRRFPESVVFTGNSVLPSGYELRGGFNGLLSMFAVRSLEGEGEVDMGHLGSPKYPFGAGLCVRAADTRDACKHWLGTSKRIMGRTGTCPTGGEEIWLAHWLTRGGQKVVFSDRLKLTHHVDQSRFSLEYVGRMAFEYGYVTPLMALSIAEFKTIRSPYLNRASAWIYGFGKLVGNLLKYTLKPNMSNYAKAVGGLGTVFFLLEQRERDNAL